MSLIDSYRLPDDVQEMIDSARARVTEHIGKESGDPGRRELVKKFADELIATLKVASHFTPGGPVGSDDARILFSIAAHGCARVYAWHDYYARHGWTAAQDFVKACGDDPALADQRCIYENYFRAGTSSWLIERLKDALKRAIRPGEDFAATAAALDAMRVFADGRWMARPAQRPPETAAGEPRPS